MALRTQNLWELFLQIIHIFSLLWAPFPPHTWEQILYRIKDDNWAKTFCGYGHHPFLPIHLEEFMKLLAVPCHSPIGACDVHLWGGDIHEEIDIWGVGDHKEEFCLGFVAFEFAVLHPEASMQWEVISISLELEEYRTGDTGVRSMSIKIVNKVDEITQRLWVEWEGSPKGKHKHGSIIYWGQKYIR